MNVLQKGRVCVKVRGRDAGKKLTVVAVKDKNRVVLSDGKKEVTVNLRHIMPLPEMK